jgi:hypothetical protein
MTAVTKVPTLHCRSLSSLPTMGTSVNNFALTFSACNSSIFSDIWAFVKHILLHCSPLGMLNADPAIRRTAVIIALMATNCIWKRL